jgi:hypothetical protein
MIKFNVNQRLVKMNGEPLMWQEVLNGQLVDTTNQATLKEVIVNSLLAKDEKEGKKKLHNFTLAKKIQKAENDIELSSEDIVLIKGCIETNYGTLIYGQSCEMIEPITPEK